MRKPKQKTGGVDSYKTVATQTSVDYTAGMAHQKPGSSGPDRVKSNAKVQHAPVPGYTPHKGTTSVDYTAGMAHQKPGTCGPSKVGKKGK